MNLEAIKQSLAQKVANTKQQYLSEDFSAQRDKANQMYSGYADQMRGIYMADTAPTEKQQHTSNPVTNIPDDSILTRAVKSIYNTVAPDSLNVGINYGGMKHYNTDQLGYQSNKEFNDLHPNDLAKRIQDTPDDPNGAGTFYYLKVRNGYDKNGNANWVYKAGTSADSAFQRYLGELRPDEYQVVASKRTNAYQDLERLVHGNKSFMQQRSFAETGMHKNSGDRMVSGNSELYNKDILGLDTKQDALTYQNNKLADYQKYQDNMSMSHNSGLSNMGASLGSGAINLAGKGIKALGELESTSTDNNFLTRAGKDFASNADKYANYNRHDQNVGGYKMQSGATKLLNGDLSGLLDMADGIVTGGPEAFLNSAPEMIAQTAGGLTPIGLAAKAGVLLSNTNDQLDNRLENTGVRKDATWEEKAGVLAAQSIVQAMDTAAFKFVTQGAKVAILGEKTGQAIPIAEFLKWKSPTFIGAFAKGLSTASKGVEGIAVEGAQEASQEALNILQEQLSTEKYNGQDVGAILGSAKNIERMKTAASQGAIAGGSMSMAASSAAGARDTYKGVSEAIADRNMRDSARPGSVGESEFNSAALDTVAHDATQTYKDLDNLHSGINDILKADSASEDKITSLDQITKTSPELNSKVQEVKSAVLSNTMQSMSPEMSTQLREVIRSNPDLESQVSQAEQALSQQVDPTNPISPEVIAQRAMNSVINNMPFSEAIQLLRQIAPDSVSKYLGSFDSKAAQKALTNEIVNQQNAQGMQANEAVRRANYQRENVPKTDDVNVGIQKLSERSSKWGRKAVSNVSDILSKLSDSALTEAVSKTGELAKATKKTRSLWQTLKGQEKESGVLDPVQIAELIKQEQAKRTKSSNEVVTFLHGKGWSKDATKDMIGLVKQIDAISKSVGMDSVSTKTGSTLIKSDPVVKKLFHSIGSYINNISTVPDMKYARDLIEHLKLNGHIMNERLINALESKLDKATIKDDSTKPQKKESLLSTLVVDKSSNMVQKLIDSGQLNTKHALAGVLRSNKFGNKQQIGIVRKAITTAEKSGEITTTLAKAMHNRLDLLTQVFDIANQDATEVVKDVSETLPASETFNTLLGLLQEYDSTITSTDVASIVKEAPQERLDKIVKMICG